MASVNRVTILGNVGKDPEVRFMPNGMAACSISIATTSKRKDKNTGESIETTEWHRIQFFDKLAEIVGQYVKKGNPLYIEGRLKYGKFTNKDGIEQHTCDIVASEIQLLGSKESGAAPSQAPRQQAPAAPRTGGASGFEDMNDDVPFNDPLKNRAYSLAI